MYRRLESGTTGTGQAWTIIVARDGEQPQDGDEPKYCYNVTMVSRAASWVSRRATRRDPKKFRVAVFELAPSQCVSWELATQLEWFPTKLAAAHRAERLRVACI